MHVFKKATNYPKISLLLGGWEPFIPMKFSIKHRPKRSLIYLKGWERGKVLFDEEIYDRNNSSSLKGGRIGALAHSQAFLKFSNLSYRYLKTHVTVKKSFPFL